MRRIAVASNPSRRRKQSPAQRRASLKNLAKARRARGGSRRKTTTRKRRRRNPASPAAPRSVTRMNPRRRRGASGSRRRRRNPSRRGVMGLVDRQLIPALVMGGGAVVNDLTFALLSTRVPFFPAALAIGPMRHLGKAASAIGLGWLARFAVGSRTADRLTAGALTVVGYNVVRDVLARVAPTLPMGEYLDPGLGYYGAGLNPGMGEYLNDIPGTGVGIPRQLTQGTPYMGARGAASAWPASDEADYSMSYDS